MLPLLAGLAGYMMAGNPPRRQRRRRNPAKDHDAYVAFIASMPRDEILRLARAGGLSMQKIKTNQELAERLWRRFGEPAWERERRNPGRRFEIRFSVDTKGRPRAHYWSPYPNMRWLPIGYDKAKLQVATGQASEAPRRNPAALRSVHDTAADFLRRYGGQAPGWAMDAAASARPRSGMQAFWLSVENLLRRKLRMNPLRHGHSRTVIHAVSNLGRPQGKLRTACGMPALEVYDSSPFAEDATCPVCRAVAAADPNWWRPGHTNPLRRGRSRAAIGANIRELIRSGRPKAQAIAIAMRTAGVPRR